MSRVLLDNCVDLDFKPLLVGHEVLHALDVDSTKILTGAFIRAAESQGFDALVTVDKQMQFQQNLKGLGISVITLCRRFFLLEFIVPLAQDVLHILENLPKGAFLTVEPRT